MKTKKKINLPLILCALFVGVLSCFAFFKVDNYSSVSADTISSTYNYSGSNLFFPIQVDKSNTDWLDMICFAVDISTDGVGNVTINWSRSTGFCNVDRFNYNNLSISYKTISAFYYNTTSNQYYTFSTSADFYKNTFLRYYDSANGTDRYTPFRINCDTGFIANIVSYELGFMDGQYNYIKYYDVNNKTLMFRFNSYESSSYNLTNRIYYLSPDLSDNQVYNQGYQDGINDNQQNVYNDGYANGERVGYNNGYAEGIEDSNVYTFSNLLGAVIDTPITYFRSLFNFELLGVNLTDFFLGLFTLCVIVTIVKMCLGR